MIVSSEVVDKAPDDEEDHQEHSREHEHRPKDAQQRVRVNADRKRQHLTSSPR
jgi:hypothetical protein